jgi:spore germination cell wall hydrolase CwlJ-like protein
MLSMDKSIETLSVEPTIKPTPTPIPTPEPTIQPWEMRIKYLYSYLPEKRTNKDLDYIAKAIYLFAGKEDKTFQTLIGQVILEESRRRKKSIEYIVLNLFRLKEKNVKVAIPPEEYYFTAYEIIWGANVIPEPYTIYDFMLIARTVHREFLSEPDEGKIAGSQVILNRSRKWHNTIETVVFARHQFSVTQPRQRFWSFRPLLSDYKCVLRALQGEKIVPYNTFYFHATSLGKRFWKDNYARKYWGTIGRTSFYINITHSDK